MGRKRSRHKKQSPHSRMVGTYNRNVSTSLSGSSLRRATTLLTPDPERSVANVNIRERNLVTNKVMCGMGLQNVNGFHLKDAEAKRYAGMKTMLDRKLCVLILTETHASKEVHGDRWVFPHHRNDPSFSYYSSSSQRSASNGYIGGVGFLVGPGVDLKSFTAVSHRLAMIEIVVEGLSFTVIGAYSPTDREAKGSTDMDRGVFFQRLDDLVMEARTKFLNSKMKSRIIVAGDFNCRIGEDSLMIDQMGPSPNSASDSGDTSANGWATLSLCTNRNLLIANFAKVHEDRNRHTWYRPGQASGKTVDLFLLSRPDVSSCLRDYRTRAGLGVDSDHCFVELQLNLAIPARARRRKKSASKSKSKASESESSSEKRVTLKWPIDKGGRKRVAASFKKKFTAIGADDDLEPGWDITTDLIAQAQKEVAEEEREYAENFIYETSLDEDLGCGSYRRAVDEHMAAKTAFHDLPTDENKRRVETAIARCEAERKRIVGQKHELFGSDLNEWSETKDIKLLFHGLHQMVKEYFTPTLYREQMSSQIDDRVFAEHCAKVFDRGGRECQTLPMAEAFVDWQPGLIEVRLGPLTETEVALAISQTKMDKAPGEDTCLSNVFRICDEVLTDRLVHDFHLIWPTPEDIRAVDCEGPELRTLIPPAWRGAIVHLLWKNKGSKKDPNSYRTIWLLDVQGKVMVRGIVNRIKPLIVGYISNLQAGFVEKRGTAYSAVSLRLLQQHAHDRNIPLVAGFVDFTKAFDSLPWRFIWDALYHLGVPGELLELLRQCHEGAVGVIRGNQQATFSLGAGVRQGSVEGPHLWNLCFEVLLRLALRDYDGVELRRVEKADHVDFTFGDTSTVYKIPYLIFADDLAILAHSIDDLKEALTRLSEKSALLRVLLSFDKTQIVWLAGRPSLDGLNDDENVDAPENPNEITVPDFFKGNGEVGRIKVVEEFEYLGTTFSSDASTACRKTITGAIKRSNKAMSILRRLFRSRKLDRKVKIQFVLKCVFPALFYGCESWRTTAVLLRRLQTHLNDIRRAVIGKGRVKQLAGPVHRRTIIYKNTWLRKQVPLPHPRTPIARRRLKFVGTILRKGTNDPVAWLLNSSFTGDNWESAKGGRFASHYLKCLKSDIEWLSGISDIRALQIFINYSATSVSRCSDLLTPVEMSESKWKDYIRLFEGFTSIKSVIKSMEELGSAHRQHMTASLLKPRIRNIICGAENCYRRFAENKELFRHMRQAHMTADDNIWHDNALVCPEHGCESTYRRLGWLKFHLNHAHRSKLEDYD